MKHGLDEFCTFYPFLKDVLQKAKRLPQSIGTVSQKLQANS